MSSSSDDEQTLKLDYIPPDLKTNDCIDLSPQNTATLLKKITKEGTGRNPVKGDTVFMHYTGTLPDGTKFDSSYEHNTPFSFQLGSAKVIQSWEICVRSMKTGEECLLTTSAKYAYGKSGYGDVIPPNSPLCFQMVLVDFHGEDVTPEKNGLVLRSIISKGSGYLVPRDGAKVRISYTAKVGDRVVDDREDLEYEIGKGEDLGLAEGLDLAVRWMKKEEKSIFVVKYPLSCRVYETDDISEYSSEYTVEYVITLKDFEKVKQVYEMDSSEKLESAAKIKERGNHLLKLSCYNSALRWYERGKEYLTDWDVTPTSTIPKDVIVSRDNLALVVNLNISLVRLKLGDFKDAVTAADEACKIDSMCFKAHLRAAKAYCELGDFDMSIDRFTYAGECGASCDEVKREIQNVKIQRRAYREKEKSIFGNVFNRNA